MKLTVRMLSALISLHLVGMTVFAGEDPRMALARKAQSVLERNCHQCHGKEGSNEGGFNFVLRLDKLVGDKLVAPRNQKKSYLLERIIEGEMPPSGTKVRPSEEDIAVLKEWIDAGAPAPASPARRSYITRDAMVDFIVADLEKRPARHRKFFRYFTLIHLLNAGYSQDELETHRLALAKLVNSLSWSPRLVHLQPVDPEKTILGIDIRDVKWDVQMWQDILGRYEYGIALQTPRAEVCRDLTECKLPYVRADWFAHAASRPPLYHQLLKVPEKVGELETLMRIDTALNIRQERVARAGFLRSGVSRNNRLIERHETPYGAYWVSYDFAGNTGQRNLFDYPLGPDSGRKSFQHDGGEIIFNLPNGLQGYVLIDRGGNRIDSAPTEIVSDPRQSDRAVLNGISCMSCHYAGIIPKADEVRGHVQANRKAFDDADAILSLYPAEREWKKLQEGDAQRFQKALNELGIQITETGEPITNVSLRYQDDVDIDTAAAELGMAPTQLTPYFRRPELARAIGRLRVPGGAVKREVFSEAFGQVVALAKLGDLTGSPNPLDPGTIIKPPEPGRPRVLKLQAAIGDIILSNDRRWVYILNLSEGQIQRLDTRTFKLDNQIAKLSAGTEKMRKSPDGRFLYTCAAPNGHDYHNPNKGGRFDVVDAATFKVVGTIATPFSPWDMAADDRGYLYVTIGGGQSTKLPVIDTRKKEVVAEWMKHLWHRNVIRISPDQQRLYLAVTDLSPLSMEAVAIPDDLTSGPTRAAARGPGRAGGRFSILPDGKVCVLASGQVLRLSSTPTEDLKPLNAIAPHASLATDLGSNRVFVGTAGKEIKVYSYPDFDLVGTIPVDGIAHQMALDYRSGMLYYAVAGNSKTVGRLPPTRLDSKNLGVSDLHLLDIRSYLQEEGEKDR